MELKYKNAKVIWTSLLVGIFIELSVIVPGISGSTIAKIMQVYYKIKYAFGDAKLVVHHSADCYYHNYAEEEIAKRVEYPE